MCICRRMMLYIHQNGWQTNLGTHIYWKTVEKMCVRLNYCNRALYTAGSNEIVQIRRSDAEAKEEKCQCLSSIFSSSLRTCTLKYLRSSFRTGNFKYRINIFNNTVYHFAFCLSVMSSLYMYCVHKYI